MCVAKGVPASHQRGPRDPTGFSIRGHRLTVTYGPAASRRDLTDWVARMTHLAATSPSLVVAMCGMPRSMGMILSSNSKILRTLFAPWK